MKKYFGKLCMGGVLLFSLSMSLTSCEDILGHWERPTAVPDSTPTPAPDPAPTPASEDLATPLTLEAVSGTVTVTIKTDFTAGKTIEYSTDDGATWTEGTPSIGGGADIDACANPVTITGSKIMLRGTNAAYADTGSKYTKIVCSADCYIYGNVMSLIDKDNFATLTAFDTTEGKNAFFFLFYGNTHIKNHAEKKLLLPATTLAIGCYINMFNGCTSLTTAPELPATSLAVSCYSNMFNGCSSLTTAPELPATTLANGCYSNMFNGCSSLTTAPELPATSLAVSCYSNMFNGCSSLTTAPELPATTLMTGCYQSMFSGCSSLTTAPELKAETLPVACYESMFKDCTDLTTAYVKAAYTTTGNACANMFNGCTATGAKTLHTTTASKTSWDGVMPSTWAGWTAVDDWN